MSSLAQYSPWHKAYAAFKGAVKESAEKIFGDKKLETEGKADKAGKRSLLALPQLARCSRVQQLRLGFCCAAA
jgi:hypothetical protein